MIQPCMNVFLIRERRFSKFCWMTTRPLLSTKPNLQILNAMDHAHYTSTAETCNLHDFTGLCQALTSTRKSKKKRTNGKTQKHKQWNSDGMNSRISSNWILSIARNASNWKSWKHLDQYNFKTCLNSLRMYLTLQNFIGKFRDLRTGIVGCGGWSNRSTFRGIAYSIVNEWIKSTLPVELRYDNEHHQEIYQPQLFIIDQTLT